MSDNEEATMAQADNLEGDIFQLVAQVPGQVKISGPPRKRRAPRPRRSKVEQRRLPSVPASGDESKA
jgi:hypothetical protein